MTRQDFPGGWYVDALPTGERCVLLKAAKTIETHVGKLPLPIGESFGVLFLALTNIGSFRFAGQAHDTTNPAAHEWIDGLGWRALPPPCCGTNPVIYDVHGVLLRSDCSIGSQGWRYVDDAGKPVTGDDTLRFTLTSGGLIHEFTEIDGLIIGQGHEEGVRVWDGAHERRLHPGACFNIRVHYIGQQVTVSFYEVAPDGLSAHIYDLTLSELRALPIVGAAPIPVPQPKPEPPPVPVQNRAAELAAFHLWWNGSQHLTDDTEKHRFTEALAGKLNALDGSLRWGRKARAGTDAKSKDTLGYWLGPLVPHNATDGKVDAFDVIASTGAVSWDLRAEQNDPGYRSIDARWFPVTAATVPNPGPIEPNPGTPPAPPVDLSAVLAKLDALTSLLMDLRAAVETTALDVETIHARVMQPITVTFPKYSGRIGGTGRFSTAIDLEPVK